MQLTGAQLMVRLLERQGVRTVAGIPGGAILPLLHDLPARELRPALEFLWAQDAAAARAALLGQLRHLHYTPLQEAMDLLLQDAPVSLAKATSLVG